MSTRAIDDFGSPLPSPRVGDSFRSIAMRARVGAANNRFSLFLHQLIASDSWRAMARGICRVTVFDKIAIALVSAFLYIDAGVACCAYLAVGDAPSGRLWAFLAQWALTVFVVLIAAPWALCRTMHAGSVAVGTRRKASV